jgi:hypothetical protein
MFVFIRTCSFCVLPAAETTPLMDMSNHNGRESLDNGQESPEESTDSVVTVTRAMLQDNTPLDVRLEFQGKSGGLVVFKDQKHLNIVPPVGATNCE